MLPSAIPDVAEWHRAGFLGRGVGVAHLDTGADGLHPGLAGFLSGFVHVEDSGELVEPARATDDDGHGTHTAGIIASVAPEAKLYSASAIEGGEAVVRLLAGLDWFLRQPVRVVIMPLGLRRPNPILEVMLTALQDRGMLVIVPIGNDGAGRGRYPGGLDSVLSVGAVDEQGKVASFSGSLHPAGSTRCLKPDVVAPGVSVESFRRGGGTEERTGTSMAASIVAGIAAILFAAKPGAPAAEVASCIVSSARPLHPQQAHRAAAGIVSPAAALKLLLGSSQPPTLQFIRKPEPPGCGIDRKLRAVLDAASESEMLSAVAALREDFEIPEADVRLRLAHGRILVMKARAELIRQLASDPRVSALSATGVDRWVFD